MAGQGEPVSGPMLDCVVAACSQMGDLGRAFETFEAYGALGMKPDAQAYNAVLMGCIHHGMTASVPKARLPLWLLQDIHVHVFSVALGLVQVYQGWGYVSAWHLPLPLTGTTTRSMSSVPAPLATTTISTGVTHDI